LTPDSNSLHSTGIARVFYRISDVFYISLADGVPGRSFQSPEPEWNREGKYRKHRQTGRFRDGKRMETNGYMRFLATGFRPGKRWNFPLSSSRLLQLEPRRFSRIPASGCWLDHPKNFPVNSNESRALEPASLLRLPSVGIQPVNHWKVPVKFSTIRPIVRTVPLTSGAFQQQEMKPEPFYNDSVPFLCIPTESGEQNGRSFQASIGRNQHTIQLNRPCPEHSSVPNTISKPNLVFSTYTR
jgi:hypothetical protein